MSLPIYIVDEIGEVVSTVSTQLLPALKLVDPNIQAVNYYYGHPKEILETLFQKDASDTESYFKYPAVFLFQDFTEGVGKDIGITTVPRLHIVIATSTDPNYKASERYAVTFKPILYPIYYKLIDQLWKSGKILAASSSQIVHTKIDRVFWGRQMAGKEQNVTNSWLDAIEITDLQLKFYNKNCQTN